MSSTPALKGYDHQFVEPSPDDLLCLICFSVAREPQQISCCGKVLCRGCLEEQKKHSNNCPQCRKSILSFSDKRSERYIFSLKVKCDNVSNGCEWTGELRSLDEHLTSCNFTLLPCPNECKEVEQLFRKDMEKHKKECPRRQYECPHCKETGEYEERMTKHLEECPMIEVPCPKRECKENILRCDISGHLSECMFEDVPCKYANIGCKEKVIRRDLCQLKDHEGDSQQHLQLAVDAVQQQKLATQQQQLAISDMKTQLQLLQNKALGPTKFMYKFTDFHRHKRSVEHIYSPAFYSSPGGYKMCICVDASKDVLVPVYLMRGENDDLLAWPFTGTVTVELLNQLEDKDHYSWTIGFPQILARRRVTVNQERASIGYECISHSDLGYNEAKNCQYLKDDCLYFRITVDAESSSKPWLIV